MSLPARGIVNGATHVLIFQHTSECLGFNSSGQEIFDQDRNGHQITFAYNGSGNITSLTDTQNRLTSFGYDSSGRINLITDPINRTVQLGYGSNNNLTSIIDLNGKTTTLGYTSGSHDLNSIATPVSGHKTTIGYQTSGNRVNQITDALTDTTSVAYYSPGSMQCGSITTLACTTFQDANNHTTIYGSDDLQVKAVLDGNGNMASTSYTPDANVSTYTDPLKNVTTFGYDSTTNNLTSTKDGNGALVTYDYDNSNPYQPNKATDAQGNSISYSYDSNGNLTSATDTTTGGTGSSATYTYNTSGVAFGSYLYGLLTQVKDGNGHITAYSYDSVGNLHTVTPPSPLGQHTIGVDGVSRVSSVTDGRGNILSKQIERLDALDQRSSTTLLGS